MVSLFMGGFTVVCYILFMSDQEKVEMFKRRWDVIGNDKFLSPKVDWYSQILRDLPVTLAYKVFDYAGEHNVDAVRTAYKRGL